MYDLNERTVEQAQAQILGAVCRLEAEAVPIACALGRVLAEDVSAPIHLPPFTNSAMDGYAVRWVDIRGVDQDTPAVLPVVDEIHAGSAGAGRQVLPGTAVRIMTGAIVPESADTVVPFELTDEEGRLNAHQPLTEVAILSALRQGANLRLVGEDVRKDERVLGLGEVLTGPKLALLAALGCSEIEVVRRPRVAILSTGDEVQALGHPLAPGQVYDTNQVMLTALASQIGAIPLPFGTARDDVADIAGKVQAAIAENDIVLTSGGVSAGAFDVVKDVLTELGELEFWKVDMKPGKPLAFGSLRDASMPGRRIPLIGLPGNPVAALVAFELFARPALRRMMGHPCIFLPNVTVALDGPIENRHGGRHYVRGIVRWDGGRYRGSPLSATGAGNVYGASQANALLEVPSRVEHLPTGAQVSAHLLFKGAGLWQG